MYILDPAYLSRYNFIYLCGWLLTQILANSNLFTKLKIYRYNFLLEFSLGYIK